jgi:hypothetical protein
VRALSRYGMWLLRFRGSDRADMQFPMWVSLVRMVGHLRYNDRNCTKAKQALVDGKGL